MNRITEANLKNLVEYLNKITDNPVEPYTKKPDGSFTANIGNYHIDSAYGGHKLVRMQSSGGGIMDPFNTGFVSKRELYNAIHIFIKGLECAKGAK